MIEKINKQPGDIDGNFDFLIIKINEIIDKVNEDSTIAVNMLSTMKAMTDLMGDLKQKTSLISPRFSASASSVSPCPTPAPGPHFHQENEIPRTEESGS